jgi:ribosomal protein S27AE
VSSISIQLKLSKDTGRYLVAAHDGADFWFDKQQVASWHVEDDMVSIELEERAWQRRLHNVHPVETETVVLKTRKCLCCGNTFQAEKNLFVCVSCKRTESWRAGGTVFVA